MYSVFKSYVIEYESYKINYYPIEGENRKYFCNIKIGLSHHSFYDGGITLFYANTHRNQSVSSLVSFKLRLRRCGLSTSLTYQVDDQRNGASLWIDGDSSNINCKETSITSKNLSCEGIIDFNMMCRLMLNLLYTMPLTDRGWTDTHNAWFDTRQQQEIS